jgi:hypothetical protein
MIISAHLGHWYSAFGFLVPAVLVVLWIRYQARRERRRQEFAQYWTLELRDGRWSIVAMDPAPPSRAQRRARRQLVPPPWSAPDSEPEVEPALADQAAARSAGEHLRPE